MVTFLLILVVWMLLWLGALLIQMFFCLPWFRPLRGFDLVKDRDTGNSKGYGFCVYQVTLQGHIS
jgi:hypothetical protein